MMGKSRWHRRYLGTWICFSWLILVPPVYGEELREPDPAAAGELIAGPQYDEAIHSPALITADETGTVKFGDYTWTWESAWEKQGRRRFVFDLTLWLIIGIVLLCGTGLAVSIRGIASVLADARSARLETAALVTGDFMPLEKKKRLQTMRRRGGGLGFKLASFTSVLVLVVVIFVSAPIYYMMLRTREETLLQGLWDRATVLMEGLAAGARAYLSEGHALELGYLPAQSAVMPEVRYVTITGLGMGDTVFTDRVWASNDPDIGSKIDTAEFQPGVSRLTDGLTLRVEQLSGEIWSEPAFSTRMAERGGNTSFMFFKPVMFLQGPEDMYFRGLIRLNVSIDSILKEIVQDRWILLRVIIIIAFAAIIMGALGALILAALIVRPIRKLAAYVEKIRDIEDKTKLAGEDIVIKGKDELAVLGKTINDMAHSLVKAALASQDLTVGKELQKKFIPLQTDQAGNKLTSGVKDTSSLRFFGYYEGAKGISGDYFDYKDLDGRYFAIIKCDAAGKGIPAALIMIQVATMFLNYFKTWKPTVKGMHIEDLVYQINDFIEALNFKGRFAAFTLALYDTQTGLVRFCNAGDNIVHWYDASERRMKILILPATPAAGVLPNSVVESRGGYLVRTMTLDPGDTLFLYTDGIEEAKRKFRNTEFREILCTEGAGDYPAGTPHLNHVVGQGDEELGADRVEAIINAVMNRRVYTLHKHHNPEESKGNADLHFDFSSCWGTVEEAIMALVSVEKMFRLYKDPGAGEESLVLVDKKVDAFLKEHFLQYRNYCSYTRKNPGNDAYLYYTHVKEDEQYDDLTIVGISRK